MIRLDGTPRPVLATFTDHAPIFYGLPDRPAPDFALLADPYGQGPFLDLFLLGTGRYVQLRDAGHTVVLRTCDHIPDSAACSFVEGCPGLCF